VSVFCFSKFIVRPFIFSLAFSMALLLSPNINFEKGSYTSSLYACEGEGEGDDGQGNSTGSEDNGGEETGGETDADGNSTGGSSGANASGVYFDVFEYLYESLSFAPKAYACADAAVNTLPLPKVTRSFGGDYDLYHIVATNISPAGVQQLQNEGYDVVLQQETGRVSIVKLRLPDNVPLRGAWNRVSNLNRNPANRSRRDTPITVDFNHYYRTQAAPQEAQLIAWPAVSGRACSASPRIGIIDTAVNRQHPALQGSRIQSLSVLDGADGAQKKPSSAVHGTAVASIIAGLMPSADITTIDVFERSGLFDTRTDSFYLRVAIDKMIDRGVQVLNLSLAGPRNALVKQGIDRAIASGIVVVAAAGNNGPRTLVYPAGYEAVLTVTAVDRNLKLYQAAGQGRHVDLSAPGVGVVAANAGGGSRAQTGTSFAVPFVAAAAGALKARQPGLNASGVLRALSGRAKDLGPPKYDTQFGHGLLQANGLC
jgi:hypothetical protein